MAETDEETQTPLAYRIANWIREHADDDVLLTSNKLELDINKLADAIMVMFGPRSWDVDDTLPDRYRAVAIAFRLNASAIPATAIADELEALWRAVLGGGVGSTNHTDATEQEFNEWWASELGGEPDWGSSRDIDMFVAWKGGLAWKR